MSDLPAIIGAIGLLIGTVFGGLAALDRRRNKLDDEALAELEDYHRWHPRMVRAVVLLRASIAGTPEAAEPPGIADLIVWPPPQPKAKHTKGEVSADADQR